jgi:hypothetical protein
LTGLIVETAPLFSVNFDVIEKESESKDRGIFLNAMISEALDLKGSQQERALKGIITEACQTWGPERLSLAHDPGQGITEVKSTEYHKFVYQQTQRLKEVLTPEQSQRFDEIFGNDFFSQISLPLIGKDGKKFKL